MPSENYFEPEWTEKVTIPVKRVGDRWEFFCGGDVPVRDGTLGELTINADRINDERFLKLVSQETVVKILEEGTCLMVALNDRSKGGARLGAWPDVSLENVPAGTTRFEPVHIGPRKLGAKQLELAGASDKGGLWLRLKGLERSELVCSTLLMPSGFPKKTALSLNQAFTLLSRAYENTPYLQYGECLHPVLLPRDESALVPLG
ncbi:hypothetical protein OKW30_004682 [Paraburkholderia sp. Clong3]|uniref:hypothetical protein n=1 Tax=Paraburkholderia sp. Clong3 TaxID=2991061 RepID=UPI003D1E0149